MSFTIEEILQVKYIKIWDGNIVKIIAGGHGPYKNSGNSVIYFMNNNGFKEVLSIGNVTELFSKEEYPEYYL